MKVKELIEELNKLDQESFITTASTHYSNWKGDERFSFVGVDNIDFLPMEKDDMDGHAGVRLMLSFFQCMVEEEIMFRQRSDGKRFNSYNDYINYIMTKDEK